MITEFKNTELGYIPTDWNIIFLNEIADIDVENLRSSTPDDYCFNYISLECVERGGLKFYSTETFASAPSRARRILRYRDILFGTVRPNLQSHLHFTEVGKEWVCSTGFSVIRCRNGVASSGYVFAHLFSPTIARQVDAVLSGSNYPAISGTNVKTLRLPIPPTKAEQEAIAEALGDADALIDALERLLAKKRNLKQGAMQELLTGERRLPGFRGEWSVKMLRDLASIRSGGTPSTIHSELWDGDVEWCTPTDITALMGYKYLSSTVRKITRKGLESSSAEMIPANSIVMTSRATIGECAINIAPVSTNQGFKNFVPFEAVDVEFLYYLLLTKKQDFISLCGGSTFLEIGKTQLAIFEVRLPKQKAEQTAIAQILSDMDAEIAALEQKLVKAHAVKQGMMQELLTGRTRLI